MKDQPKYSYQRDSSLWAVIRWEKHPSGGYKGEKVKTYILKDKARKEVFRLNGWRDNRLEFSTNWNGKLHNTAFTSIRLWNEKKYNVGREYDVWLQHINKGFARLVSVKRLKLHEINEHIARLDTGYSAAECQEIIRTMYKNKRIDWSTQELAYLLFVFVKEEKTLF